MPKPKTSRKARFKAALALAGLTQSAWAVREGVTPSYVSHILNGVMESKTLTEKIDAFTEEYLKAIAA